METTYTIASLSEILSAKATIQKAPGTIEHLVIDTRTVIDPEYSLFFALNAVRNGHEFLEDAYQQGIRNFVISDKKYVGQFNDANYLLVDDVQVALQALAKYHRESFSLPLIAISGSNGKTIVKEWLNQLLVADENIVRSPRSFNSQIGVPLSLWQINDEHTLAIIEAGISKKGEMTALAQMIQPTIGILTNIGEAHAEGFKNQEEKLREKLQLFAGSKLFIYGADYTQGIPTSALPGETKFCWGQQANADLQLGTQETTGTKTLVNAQYKGQQIQCTVPFTDKASIENAMTCWTVLLALGYSAEESAGRLARLSHMRMRLELKTGVNQCSVIDDSYSADVSSLAIALDFLNLQNQHQKKTLILSDLLETGKNNQALYEDIAALIRQKNVNRLVGIGPNIASFQTLFPKDSSFYPSTQAFIDDYPQQHFANETILVKGARKFEFERITKLLSQKIHDTVMEIDLNALASNLRFYKSKLQPGVKVMAMVKAFSYGSGSFEIANVLQYHKVDYLTVAYADEGFALRKAGITLPIMVMSPEPSAFEAMIKYRLEPEIYNIDILKSFLSALKPGTIGYPIHLKIDTGMHRLGFEAHEIKAVLTALTGENSIKVISVFSHLVGSDEEAFDDFTHQQLDVFNAVTAQIEEGLGYTFIRHISNTAAVTRFPEAQLDMVRLGIGLYGFDAGLYHHKSLHTVTTLKTTVTQIKHLPPAETVGYSRRGQLPEGGTIATVKIGYADGYRRSFGNGVGKMLVRGKLVPTIGSICMDMCMLNVTGTDVKVGDEVIIFNDELTIADLAKQVQTIPYEILTNISQRVKRIYFYE